MVQELLAAFDDAGWQNTRQMIGSAIDCTVQAFAAF
jgi:hypothetical protein